jgi:predicted DNA binding CopG/RHH family protein
MKNNTAMNLRVPEEDMERWKKAAAKAGFNKPSRGKTWSEFVRKAMNRIADEILQRKP